MNVITGTIQVQSKGENDMIDVTEEIENAVQKSGLRNGLVTVFVSGSTGAVTTIEHEAGLLKDFPAMLERVAPKNGVTYEHDEAWHDGNGHSHLRASIIGPSLTIPLADGRLALGTWQQIVFVELDIRARLRKLVVQILGE